MTIEIRADDLSAEPTRRLVRRHLDGMRALSPAESCHALDIDGLIDPTVSFWAAWIDGSVTGIGALKDLGDGRGEIKSMRVDDAFLGRGVGRAILERILEEASVRGMTRLWLETGSAAEFLPARTLYERAGFVECPPFGNYSDDPLSTFMTKALGTARITPAR